MTYPHQLTPPQPPDSPSDPEWAWAYDSLADRLEQLAKITAQVVECVGYVNQYRGRFDTTNFVVDLNREIENLTELRADL